jgi:DNA-directed RNA polymerase specialized sigma24 family protein
MPVEKPAAGFEEIYCEQRLALLRLAYLLCGSRETSEDVVQSAFASAHARWEQIESPVPYL